MSIGWNEEIKKTLGSCGTGCLIGNDVKFLRPNLVHLGNNVRIDPYTIIGGNLTVGNNCQICSHVSISGRGSLTMKDWTFVGFGSQIFTASEDYSGDYGPINLQWNPGNLVDQRPIIFEKYAGIASNVTIFPGVHLPEGCCIGASSLVYKNEANKKVWNGGPDKIWEALNLGMYHTTKKPLEEYSVYIGNPLTYLKSRNKENIQEISKLYE